MSGHKTIAAILAMLALCMSTLIGGRATPVSATLAIAHKYGLAGQGAYWKTRDLTKLLAEYNAGVRYWLIESNWRDLQATGTTVWSTAVQAEIQQRIDDVRGLEPANPTPSQMNYFYLDLGIQYAPSWVLNQDTLKDEFGTLVTNAGLSGGGANIYWSTTVQQWAQTYMAKLLDTTKVTSLNFHGRLWTVRVGPYGGEMVFPAYVDPGNGNPNDAYWAFDSTAQAQSPVPGWHPGAPSPNGEAHSFYYWYVGKIVGTYNWFKTQIARYYSSAYVAPVTPGAGMNDEGAAQSLIAANLECNGNCGHAGQGDDWETVFAKIAVSPTNVLFWNSGVGDGAGDDTSQYWTSWTSAKQQAYLAHRITPSLPIYGENPGHDSYQDTPVTGCPTPTPQTSMVWDFTKITDTTYPYLGLMWVREEDMYPPNTCYATVNNYSIMISHNP